MNWGNHFHVSFDVNGVNKYKTNVGGAAIKGLVYMHDADFIDHVNKYLRSVSIGQQQSGTAVFIGRTCQSLSGMTMSTVLISMADSTCRKFVRNRYKTNFFCVRGVREFSIEL